VRVSLATAHEDFPASTPRADWPLLNVTVAVFDHSNDAFSLARLNKVVFGLVESQRN
jgi:hypothetical protein